MCRKVTWRLWSDVKKNSSRYGCFFYIGEVMENMAYIALYRKWRPGSFSELVGQEHISRTLSNAITTGRIGHAYLFSGPRGTGKTSTAKILAKALNCEHGPTPEPCGKCEQCRKINDGSSMDVFEIDAASNRGIDEIRDLRETVKFAPANARYKVYIIDEVHMLTAEAFNALLKTLEEPPAHVVFILATTEPHKVPATIQSRCQRYDFKRITAAEISERLNYIVKESKLEAEPEALQLIAVQADGGLRDALSILDQCVTLAEGKITAARVRQILGLVGHEWIYRITKAIADKKKQKVLVILSELLRDGKDLKQIMLELSLHLRSLMIFQAAGTIENMDLYAEKDSILKEQGKLFTSEQIMQMLYSIQEVMNEMKWSPQPRIAVEITLLNLCNIVSNAAMRNITADTPVADKTDNSRIAALEAKLAALVNRINSKVQPVMAKQPVKSNFDKQAAKEDNIVAAMTENILPATVSAAGKKIWEELLNRLRIENKAPVLACISQGTFKGMTANWFIVQFTSSMMVTLTMRNYRKQLETILAELTGKEISLRCVCDELPEKPAVINNGKKNNNSALKSPKVAVDLNEVPPMERKPLETAFSVFGDNVTKIENDKN